MFKSFNLRTSKRCEMLDITSEIQSVLSESDIKSGICIVFTPHTTAGITINENADPCVTKDLIKNLNKLIPWENDYYTHLEGNSAAHLKSSLMGVSLTLPVSLGRLELGIWQGIYFCEFRNRGGNRKLLLTFYQ